MKTFLFLLTLPSETVAAIEDMPDDAARRAKIRRLISYNRAGFLSMLESSLLDQITHPQELASLVQGPGGESAQIVTRGKKSVRDLPETHEP